MKLQFNFNTLFIQLIAFSSITIWAFDEHLTDPKKLPPKIKNYKILFKQDKQNQTYRSSSSKKICKLMNIIFL